ncbi:MAG: hypothetical protein M1816_003322 [Peltula sp. TS41687]|nr:MAG: hypothetical protein M1816_003322 [Peltula sp. TS41687]
MAELYPKEIQVISDHPVGEAFEQFRQLFCSTCNTLGIVNSPESVEEVVQSKDGRVLARRLVDALQGHDVAQELRSKLSSTTVSDDLATIYPQVGSDGFNIRWIIPLCTLVIGKASDEAIWKAVFDLIARTPTTPPQSIPSTYKDTPITHSSASQRGSEQTRAQVDPRIFEEISACTFRDIPGFFEKYFDKADKAEQVEKIFQATKARYIDGKWADFPDPPLQSCVLDWLFHFQTNFFSHQRGIYYTTHDRPLPGSQADRQLDLLVKRRNSAAASPVSVSEHKWKDVWVIGELKAGHRRDKDFIIQLAAYAREVFASQPTRHFVHGFILHKTSMQLWVFDRSGPYSSTEFDIHEQPERFIQAIGGYLMMSDSELGLDTFVDHHGSDQFITVVETGSGVETRLQLDPEPIAYQRAIVCRGTSCYRAKRAGAESWEYVVKLSWRSDKRRAEGELLKLAQQRGVEGVAEIFAHEEITSIKQLRSGLHFGRPYKFQNDMRSTSSSFHSKSRSLLAQSFSNLYSQGLGITHGSSSQKRKAKDDGQGATKRSRSNSQASIHTMDAPIATYTTQKTSLYETNSDTFDNRIFCYLVISPPGRAIRDFRSLKELLEAFRDAIRAHKSLYEKGKILHRDISENNIIITEDNRDYKGILIDLDLAKELGSGPSGARHRTGTMEFMAIEVLKGVSHTYRHDLESFFYVFLWVCILHGWVFSGHRHKQRQSRYLRKWYQGDYIDIAATKLGHMDKNLFEEIVAEFPPQFEHAKDVARRVREVLFPFRDGYFTGTFKDPDIMYRPIIEAFAAAARDSQKEA